MLPFERLIIEYLGLLRKRDVEVSTDLAPYLLVLCVPLLQRFLELDVVEVLDLVVDLYNRVDIAAADYVVGHRITLMFLLFGLLWRLLSLIVGPSVLLT